MMRNAANITLTVLMVVLASAVMPACGQTVDPSATSRAVAFANAVNLRSVDVPSMGRLVRPFQTKNGPPFASCATHIRASDEVSGFESLWFVRSKGQRQLRAGVIVGKPPVAGGHSIVYVMRNPIIARNHVASMMRASTPECVQEMSRKETSGRVIGGEPYKRDIAAASLPFPLAGVAGYWLRVQSTVAGAVYHEKQRVPFYEDTFGFAVGPAEIVLHADGAAEPFPAAEERRLLSLLYTRAKAHALS
jgi:hypothetical protein